ncbi:MAG: ABC transporter permease subunit [Alphaproteobacteria bacterium]
MYQDIKIAASDGVCAVVGPLGPELFEKNCARFIDGFWVTIELILFASIIGLGIALVAVLARVSGNRFFSTLAYIYIYVFRGTPLLVQLWIFYFGLGGLGEEGLGPLLWTFFKDGWNVGLLVLTLNTGAYVAEILRGGIVNVPRGQMEAALAYGMTWLQAMRRIVLPQAFKIAWPAYGNEVILLLKGSALISTITVLDLMGQTRTIFARSYDLQIYVYAAILYLLLVGVITFVFRRIEMRLQG